MPIYFKGVIKGAIFYVNTEINATNFYLSNILASLFIISSAH